MIRVCGNPIFMLPITVYGRLLGRGGGVSCKDDHKNGTHINRPFPSCFELQYEGEAKCKVFMMKVSFHSYVNKTNFRI